jgi:hypothetical protein
MGARWHATDAERERIDRCKCTIDRLLDVAGASLWDVARQSYRPDPHHRSALLALERGPMKQYVQLARQAVAGDGADTRGRGEQLRKELAEGERQPLVAKLRDLVRSHREQGDLPQTDPAGFGRRRLKPPA